MKILLVFPFSKSSTGTSSYTYSIINALKHGNQLNFELASNFNEWETEVKKFKRLKFFKFFDFFGKILMLFFLKNILL